MSGHAVIGYTIGRIRKRNADAIRIYDPNYPKDINRYIELTWDTPRHYTGWLYQIEPNEKWGTGYGGDISFSLYISDLLHLDQYCQRSTR